MAVVQPIHQQDPVQALAARLDDPAVAASLHRLLDHVDLLSILVVGLSGFVSRGETISNSLAEGVSDLRNANPGAGFPPPGDIATLLQRLLTLTGPVTDSLPTVEKLLTSDLGDPRVIDTASMASRAIVKATQGPAPAPVTGIRALLRALKDDDVSRALGWVLAVAKNLGQELRQAR